MSAIMCQFCKTDNLRWKETEGGWKLFYESGQQHLCRATRDKIAKSIKVKPIGPPTFEEHLKKHFTKEGVKWILEQTEKEKAHV